MWQQHQRPAFIYLLFFQPYFLTMVFFSPFFPLSLPNITICCDGLSFKVDCFRFLLLRDLDDRADMSSRLCQCVNRYALLRIFYGASIAFEVPASYMGKADVWGRGFAFSTCLIAKVFAGCTNTAPFTGKAFDSKAMLRVGTALAVWGEITLLVGVTGAEEGLISKSTFASLVIAVLLSVVVGPFALHLRIKYDKEAKRAENLRTEQELSTDRGGKKV
jgi:hypothetical protein